MRIASCHADNFSKFIREIRVQDLTGSDFSQPAESSGGLGVITIAGNSKVELNPCELITAWTLDIET
jgi:hypothetical protein